MEVDGALEDIPLGELELEEFELLDGIDRVNGALHRQMHIVHLHQHQRLFDDAQALLPGEARPSFRRTEEGVQIPSGSAGGAGIGDLQQFLPLAEFDFSHGPPSVAGHTVTAPERRNSRPKIP